MTEQTKQYRNPYRLAEVHREHARWMRAKGIAEIDGQTPEDMERTADLLEKAEDSNRGIGR